MLGNSLQVEAYALTTSSGNSKLSVTAGHIIRINPYEVVINAPDFYNDVYVAANTRRTSIWPRYWTGVGFDGMSACDFRLPSSF
jgi:hypothetical protein